MSFCVTSDIHFYNESECRPEKARDMGVIRAIKPDFAVVTGDITQGGMDGKVNCCIPITIPHCKIPNQVKGYLEHFVLPLQKEEITVMSCMGNHDQATEDGRGHEPMLDLIRQRHGGQFYTWFIGRGLTCDLWGIVLGLYPVAYIREWLKRELYKPRERAAKYVLFWHFNLTGEMSGLPWWGDEDKEELAALLDIFRAQIECIFVGHLHPVNSFMEMWKGFRVYNTAGYGVASCRFVNDHVEVAFV
jgi:hypothetical protein